MDFFEEKNRGKEEKFKRIDVSFLKCRNRDHSNKYLCDLLRRRRFIFEFDQSGGCMRQSNRSRLFRFHIYGYFTFLIEFSMIFRFKIQPKPPDASFIIYVAR